MKIVCPHCDSVQPPGEPRHGAGPQAASSPEGRCASCALPFTVTPAPPAAPPTQSRLPFGDEGSNPNPERY